MRSVVEHYVHAERALRCCDPSDILGVVCAGWLWNLYEKRRRSPEDFSPEDKAREQMVPMMAR